MFEAKSEKSILRSTKDDGVVIESIKHEAPHPTVAKSIIILVQD